MADEINWKKSQPAPRHLARLLRANFSQISATGIYNDRNVAGTKKKSAHAEGRALDIHLNANHPDELALGDQIFEALIRKATKIGVDNVIWNRQIWSVARGGPRRYKGQSPHTDHLHVEFTRKGSQYRELNDILIDIGIIRTGIDDLGKAIGTIA
jgi:hypothetical protein